MKIILLSGGSGKRLWPLSNDARSKQFLKVLDDENGNKVSMVQRVWKQLESLHLSDSVIISTSKSQVDMITNQLGNNVPLVVEPERRDTFPAIALAATYLYSVQGTKLDEVVAVLPVDPFVENRFFTRVRELENVIVDSKANLALIGINPTYPSSKYGYIVPNISSMKNEYYQVNHFKEKPTEEQAKELMVQKAMWNGGIFAFKLGYIIDLLLERSLPIQYDELIKQYNRLPKISFDYEVVEKEEDIVVLPYDGYWKDLGTWNTLTEEIKGNLNGKGIITQDSMNTHVLNELDIPITVLGLSNIVVAASPDGILVSDKEASPRIKEVINFEQRPMYEERRWGWYKVLDHTKFENGNEVLTKKIGIHEGKNLSYQMHFKRNEIWTVIQGEGEFVLDDVLVKVKAGDVLNIPVGSKHGIKAITDLEFIEVQTGTDLIEEDIVRIYMTWAEVEENCNKKTLSI